ncbi:MAG: hypothetical protein AB2809_12335 [Candidatus Thiodiazotropha sp.]
MEASRFLTVHYLDGSSETSTFPRQAKDQYDQMSKLHDAMTTDRLAIEADSSLHVIPLNAVKCFEFSPLPDKLPDGIIRHASLNIPG